MKLFLDEHKSKVFHGCLWCNLLQSHLITRPKHLHYNYSIFSLLQHNYSRLIGDYFSWLQNHFLVLQIFTLCESTKPLEQTAALTSSSQRLLPTVFASFFFPFLELPTVVAIPELQKSKRPVHLVCQWMLDANPQHKSKFI